MGVPSKEQIAAVLAHLDAEYDAAEAKARADSPDHVWTSHPTEQEQIAKAIRDSKANNLRELQAAADRHPERFADLAIADEKDVRQLAGYEQESTVEQVLRDTASATVEQVKQGAQAVAEGAGKVAGFGLGLVWKIVPWPVWAVAGVAALGLGYFYLRPLLPAGRK